MQVGAARDVKLRIDLHELKEDAVVSSAQVLGNSLLVSNPDVGGGLEHSGGNPDEASTTSELEHLLATQAFGVERMPVGEVLRQDLWVSAVPWLLDSRVEGTSQTPAAAGEVRIPPASSPKPRSLPSQQLTSPAGQAMPPHPGPASILRRTPAVPGTGMCDSALAVVVGGRWGAIPSKVGRPADPADRTELIDAERERMISLMYCLG